MDRQRNDLERKVKAAKKKLRQISRLEEFGLSNLNEEEKIKVNQRREFEDLVDASEQKLKKLPPAKLSPTAGAAGAAAAPLRVAHAAVSATATAATTTTTTTTTTDTARASIAPLSQAPTKKKTEAPPATATATAAAPAKGSKKNKSKEAATAAAMPEHPFVFPAISVRTLDDEHDDVVLCVDVHGDVIATGSRDTSVKLWSLQTCQLVRHLGGHRGAVHGVRVLADTGMVCSASADSTLRVWQCETGEQKHEVYVYSRVLCCTHVPDHPTLILCGTAAGKVHFIDATSGINVHTLSDVVSGRVTACDARGERFVVGTAQGQVALCQMAITGEGEEATVDDTRCVWAFNDDTYMGDINDLLMMDNRVFWGDGDGWNVKWLFLQGDNDDVLYKVANRTTMRAYGTQSMAQSDAADVIASSSSDRDGGYINVRRGSTGEYLYTLRTRKTVMAMGYNDDGSALVLAGNGSEVEVAVFGAQRDTQSKRLVRSRVLMSNVVYDSDDDDGDEEDEDEGEGEGKGSAKGEKEAVEVREGGRSVLASALQQQQQLPWWSPSSWCAIL